MNHKVLCPYCGSEMKSEDLVKVDGGYLSYAVCSNDACQSIGPTVTGYETMAEARAAALVAAQARYLPPNRPHWYAQDTDDFEPRLRADVMCKGALDCATYNKLFRIWLRKPTQAEMDAAGWGDAE